MQSGKNRPRMTVASRAIHCLIFLLSIGGRAATAAPSSDFHVPALEPKDIDCEHGLEFTKTSAYAREFKTAVDGAKAFCKSYMAAHPNERNLAIVSDIDETLLDNRDEIKAHCRNWDEFSKWMQEAKAPTLPLTAQFLAWAREQGLAIFLVTGRSECDRKATIINLIKDKIAYDGLWVRPDGDHTPAEEYKTAVRKKIEELGFKIVINIGDQISDLAGGHALDCEKLPNKMYFIK